MPTIQPAFWRCWKRSCGPGSIPPPKDRTLAANSPPDRPTGQIGHTTMEAGPARFRTDPIGTPGEPQIRHLCPARWVRLVNPASHRFSARGLSAPVTFPVCDDFDVLAPPLIIDG